jgi:hypothetical protein
MSYQFEGKTYPTIAAWKAEFPAYANYSDFLRAGADTVRKMEDKIAARRSEARLRSLQGSRRSGLSSSSIRRTPR